MRGRKHFENLPKETRNRLQKLFQSHTWTDDNGYIFNCLFKQEMVYFLRYEAIDVLNAIFLDQLNKENLSLAEVLKRNLISYDITYNSIFRDIDEYIFKFRIKIGLNLVKCMIIH